jgi:hypothetical protein
MTTQRYILTLVLWLAALHMRSLRLAQCAMFDLLIVLQTLAYSYTM